MFAIALPNLLPKRLPARTAAVQLFCTVLNQDFKFPPKYYTSISALHEVNQNIWFCYECRECYLEDLIEFDWTVLAWIWNIKFIIAIIKPVRHIRIILQRSKPHCITFQEWKSTLPTRPCHHNPPTGQVWQTDMKIIRFFLLFSRLGNADARRSLFISL